jgi:hypothetical protein
MQTARIVVLTIAPGAGGVAAYPARGTDAASRPDTPPVTQFNMVDNTSEEESPKRDECVRTVRCGVQSATTIQK